MTRPKLTVSRTELYRHIWTTPCSQLAERYGVSDVGLAKACKRYDIPHPPRGYWAKLKHGKKVCQAPLPPNNDPELEIVRFDMAGFGSVRQAITDPGVEKVAAKSEQNERRIKVPERLSSPHQLVAVTKKHLAGQEPGSDGIIDCSSRSTLRVRVGIRSVGRALRIFDALLKHWEELGGEVEIGLSNYDQTPVARFRLGETDVPVSMHEKTERVDSGNGDRFSRWNARRRATGQLVLSIDCMQNEGIRRTWADGKRQRLESILDSFVAGLLRHIASTKQEQRDHTIEGAQERRVQERRERIERIVEDEKKRRSDLIEYSDRWHDAERMRAYLAAIEKKARIGGDLPEGIGPDSRWFAWATWFANAIDPLNDHGESPLVSAPEAPVNTRIDQLEWTNRTQSILLELGVADTDALHRISEEEVKAECRDRGWLVWREICRVLEGLGYDVSERQTSCW